MAKEEPKKEKKSKRKAVAAAANEAAAPAPGARAAVVASVAAFLESAGLPRTLAALQSEAGLEAGAWGSAQVNLEELVARFLESKSSDSTPAAAVLGSNEHGPTFVCSNWLTPAAAVLGSNEHDKGNDDVAGEISKKKKRSGAEAGDPESKASEPSAQEKPSENMDVEANKKQKKKKKDKGDDPSAVNAASGEATESVRNEDQKLDVDGEATEKKQKKDKVDPSPANAAIGEATETVKKEGQKLDVNGDPKEKKQKKKKDKADPSAANAASGEATETVKNDDQKLAVDGEAKEKKQKKKDKGVLSAADAGSDEATETVKNDGQKLDGKKKKSKKQGNDDDVEARLEKAELAIINKFEATEKANGDGNESREEEPKSQNDGTDDRSGAVEKKKKKDKSAVKTSEKTDAGSAPAEADGAKGNNGVAATVKDDNEKKVKKKRNKSNPEENVQVEGKEAAGKDSVPKPDDLNKSGMDVDEDHQGKSSNENAVAGQKRKLEDVEGSIAPVTLKEYSTANQSLNNGFGEDKTNEDSNIKPSKRQKKSSEPKTVTPFQRIKVDSVKFADDRLQDNSYWAKSGADTGYGAKAQEILGQVRGRGFRHEKTKKKRGTYRGGQIDLQTHSIKFENSDDE